MNGFLLTITIEAGSTVGVLLSDVVHLLVCAADLIWWDIRKVLTSFIHRHHPEN